MIDIAAMAARTVLELVSSIGIDANALCEGLPFDENSLRRMRRIRWDDYCTLLEYASVVTGGPVAWTELVARQHARYMPSEIRGIAASLVSCKQLYRFLMKVDSAIYCDVDFDVAELSQERLRIALSLPDGHRASRAFWHFIVGAWRGAPASLGLPNAKVEVKHLSDRALSVVIAPPPAVALQARARRMSLPMLRRAALGIVTLFADEARDRGRERTSAPQRDGDDSTAARVHDSERELGLTPRQAEVVTLVAAGRSNKQVAATLDCTESTVEFHLTRVMKKAGVTSRTELIAQLLR